MYKIKISSILCAVAIMLLTSCGFNVEISRNNSKDVIYSTGINVTFSEDIASFDKVELSAEAKVKLARADKFAYYVTTDSSFVPFFEFEQKGNVLYIKAKRMRDTIYLYVPENYTFETFEATLSGASQLDASDILSDVKKLDFKLNGASKLSAKAINGDGTIRLDLSGASKVRLNEIQTEWFVCEVNGASKIDVISGVAQHANFRCSGASNIDADMTVDDCSINLSGASKMDIANVVDTLSAELNGASKLNYGGKPKTCKLKSLGVSKIFAEDK